MGPQGRDGASCGSDAGVVELSGDPVSDVELVAVDEVPASDEVVLDSVVEAVVLEPTDSVVVVDVSLV